jgi:general secretion pathway protein K
VALITILLVVALLTAIVSRLSLSSEVWLRQVGNGNSLAQAGQAARAAQSWIGLILEQDNNDYDGHTDIWAQPLPPIPVGWGELSGWVEDVQARFNLNNLVDDEGQVDSGALVQFQRLLQVLELDTGLAAAVVDWIDADGSPSGISGAEDIYYLALAAPYAAANRPLADAAELRMVRGIDQQAWDKLRPHVTALPRGTTINVNTAGPEVLAAAATYLDQPVEAMAVVERWIQEADRQPYASAEDFAVRALGDKDKEMPRGLALDTEYFLAHTQLIFGEVEYRTATLYRRSRGRADIVRHARELF